MTRNEAIRCLELEDDFTSEEVKHNYARLSKTVRPEEKPEEFSKLNEAYRLLSAELRKSGRKANVSVRSSKNIEEIPARNSTETDALKVNSISKTEVYSKENGISKTDVTSKVNGISQTEVASKVNDIPQTEVASKVNDISQTEVASKVTDISKTEVVSKTDSITEPKLSSKIEKDITPEVQAEINETASSEGISAIKDNPEWKKQFIQMFAKEDIDRKRLAAIEEELVKILRLGVLDRKNGLSQFFRYGNSVVLKSPEFKAFFAERLISVQLDPEEIKSIINYYRLKKNSKSTEDIALSSTISAASRVRKPASPRRRQPRARRLQINPQHPNKTESKAEGRSHTVATLTLFHPCK